MTKTKILTLKNSHNYKNIFIITLFFLGLFIFFPLNHFNFIQNNLNINEIQDIDISGVAYYYTLNLTNPEINNTQYKHNQSITIKGIVYRPPFPLVPQVNVNVTLIFDGVDFGESIGAKNVTDATGNFSITTIIPMWVNVYQSHIINVNVTDDKNTKYNHDYHIYVGANSKLIYNEINNFPKVNGENYRITGNLYFDNNSGISGADVDVSWRINGSNSYQGILTTDSNGTFTGQLSLPSTEWNSLELILNFTGTAIINHSFQIIDNLFAFSNFTCNWNVPENITEGQNITVRGELSSSADSSFKIFNRSINIEFGGVLIKSLTTNSSGGFSLDFVPSGNGTLTVSTDNLLSIPVQASIILNVTAGTEPSPLGGILMNPMSIIIIIAVVAGIIIAVYFFSKRQAAEPTVVQIPLENKLKNITILKDTDRREESVVYLFYVFLQLSEAKFGITKQPNETINDYAIKCVRDMGLAPLKIYPFIKKIEQIIYGSGGKISEEDFKEIFSQFIALFYDFTGYQIKL